MLSTKNIVETSGNGNSNSKTLAPGLNTVTINGIALAKGYNANSYNVVLNVEGPDMGEDFEGFLVNYEDKSGPRYKGQVGRVRLTPYAFEDGVTKSGIKVNRDQSILKSIKALSTALGLADQIDMIEADTIEEFIDEANNVLSGTNQINVILGGKAFENKQGYTQYDLFIPYAKDGKYPFESADVTPIDSKLMDFNPAVHLTGKSASAAASVDSFAPKEDTSFSL